MPGRHATGRSAAMLIPGYGGQEMATVIRESREFLAAPPHPWAETRLLRPRGRLVVAGRASAALERHAAHLKACQVRFEQVNGRTVRRIAPPLRPDRHWRGLWIPEAEEIDVDAMLQGYLKVFRSAGGRLETKTNLLALESIGGRWRASTNGEAFAASVVVNAAGAWAGRVGGLAGAIDPGLRPLLRTVVLVDADEADDSDSWPQVVDVGQRWYFKPEAGRILVSPADEQPMAPQDAQPDELAVAMAVDRFERATARSVSQVRHRWAGLRTLTRDRLPVVGLDSKRPGFFWLAGQGGAGIMTAPALAKASAALLLGSGGEDDLGAALLEPFSPRRFLSEH